jgi:hypothetical protein
MIHFRNFVMLAGAAALVACATEAPQTATAPVASHAPATVATSAAAAPAASDAPKSKVPYGYQKVVMDGEIKYCRNDLVTGSRTERTKVCLTEEQLTASQDSSQNFIDDVQRHGGASTMNGTPGAGMGGAMGH